jgi:Putative serine esterase (DUF676)
MLQSDHLVVLSHGILGTGDDLEYLANRLESGGCKVLKSRSNESFKSFDGIKACGEALAQEIIDCIERNSDLNRISFVGNSLGGLYARYSISILFSEKDGSICGLKPYRFMSVATPHLGVRNWTFTDENGYSAPDMIKKIAAKAMKTTGKDIFGFQEDNSNEEGLLFRMATEASFLAPLRSFSDRRLYGNLRRDLVVPLGTAAFMSKESVQELRKKYTAISGIVHVQKTPVHHDGDLYEGTHPRNNEDRTTAMIDCLDNLGWEKIVVNFPGYFALAHNQICALNRRPKWLFGNLLGFADGEFVMDNACSWLLVGAEGTK